MMPAIRALVWEILARHRWFVGGGAAWLLVACVAVGLLPESARVQEMGTLLILPSLVGMGAFILAVTHGNETRLETRSGAFPRRLLLLPASVGILAGVPLGLVLLVPTLTWVVAALGVLQPCGARVAVFWPGLCFGVVLAWLLALSWLPMPIRWARLVLLNVVVLCFIVACIVNEMMAWPEYAIILGLAALARIAVGLAVRGVSLSRRESGDETGTALPTGRTDATAFNESFRSRLRAQLWLEWRTHGRGLALLTIILGIFFIPAIVMSEHLLRTQPMYLQYLASEPFQRLGPAWNGLSWLLIIPMLLAAASGGEMGRFGAGTKGIGMPSFVRSLPITTVDLLRCKFLAPLIHLGLVWGIVTAAALGWAIVGGHLRDMAARLSEVCGSPAVAWLTLLVVLLSGYAITYLFSVGSMWAGLFGSPGFAPLPAGLMMLVVGTGAVLLGQRWQPEYGPTLRAGLWIALVVKLLIAEYLIRYDRKRLRVNGPLLAIGLSAWAGLTAVPACTAAWFLDDPTAALAVVVLSPLGSCLATPAVLHRSRHGAWA